MEVEDNFIFYRYEVDPDFASVWTSIVQNPDHSESYDVRLECSDGQYRHSHQSLLSVTSGRLREAFQYYKSKRADKLSVDEELVINFPELVPFEELEAIINYIYNGYVSVPESRIVAFLEVCKFLAIRGLEDIKLVFMDQLDNINHFLISNQLLDQTPKEEPIYEFRLKDSDEECDDQLDDFEDSMSDSSLTLQSSDGFTALNDLSKKVLLANGDHKPRFKNNLPIYKHSKARRVGLQGRKPQVGSPLITDEFKSEGRYQCKVCFRSYLWKKSLVRHYKDLHPNNVQKVTE